MRHSNFPDDLVVVPGGGLEDRPVARVMVELILGLEPTNPTRLDVSWGVEGYASGTDSLGGGTGAAATLGAA